jgi:hypothetical protein
MSFTKQMEELRQKIKECDLGNLNTVEKAVWATTYVQILSASPHKEDIFSTAEMIGTPTEQRCLVAVNGANMAVTTLRDHFDTERLS